MKSPLVLLLFFALVQPLHATVYKGTIGKFTVYADLTVMNGDRGSEIYGAYFYESKCRDIQLEGTIAGNKYLIHAGAIAYAPEETEHFTLVKVGKALTGTWEYKGKKLDVVLRELNPADVANAYMRNPFVLEKNMSEMEQIRTAFAVFEKTDSITKLETGVELTWYKEKHWDSYLFRVTKGLSDEAMQCANDYLECEQLGAFSGFGSCSTPFGEGDFFSSIDNYFVNADFLAYEETVGYYCGGAHPDFNTIQNNLSLKDKRLIDADDILHFPGVIKSTGDNFDTWSAYRSEVFAVRVLAYLKMEYPDEFPAIEEEQEEGEEAEYYAEDRCNYDDPGVWEFSDALITPQGLKVGAYFYRFMRDCDDPSWSIIPYELVKEYLNPQYRDALMKLGK